MPKINKYKSGSIIYFEGDKYDNIYLLQKGVVVLKFINIETGRDEESIVQPGEFFGVKSALGKYPREETVSVARDSDVLVLSVQEFQDLAKKNSRLIIKMLKVFSNQLRRVHSQLENMLDEKEKFEPEDGLINTAEYYYQSGQKENAKYVFKKYLDYYPNGKYSSKAKNIIDAIGDSLESSSVINSDYSKQNAKAFYDGEDLFNQERYEEALDIFKDITEGSEGEFKVRGLFEIGKCYFMMQKWKDCISHMASLIQKYPRHSDMDSILYFVAYSNFKLGSKDKAKALAQKVLSMSENNMKLKRKAEQLLSMVEE